MPDFNADQLELVLLDRDGVINVDSPDFIKSADEFQPIPGAVQAIAAMQRVYRIAICTNQSGLGRGLFNETALAAMHDKLNDALVAAGGLPLNVYFCPHHPDAGCMCRKPKPELLEVAMRSHNSTPPHTLYAGDSKKDLLAAFNAGCHAALILTGNGATTAASQASQRAALICKDLAELAAVLNARRNR